MYISLSTRQYLPHSLTETAGIKINLYKTALSLCTQPVLKRSSSVTHSWHSTFSWMVSSKAFKQTNVRRKRGPHSVPSYRNSLSIVRQFVTEVSTSSPDVTKCQPYTRSLPVNNNVRQKGVMVSDSTPAISLSHKTCPSYKYSWLMSHEGIFHCKDTDCPWNCGDLDHLGSWQIYGTQKPENGNRHFIITLRTQGTLKETYNEQKSLS